MDKYLLEILKEVNTIIIPGLGALTITNANKGEIMFMSYLKHDDGKLTSYISKNEGIDENEAMNLVAKYVREIQIELDKGESYDMYQFGSFYKNHGEIDFISWAQMQGTTLEEKEASIEQKEVVEQPEENVYVAPNTDNKELTILEKEEREATEAKLDQLRHEQAHKTKQKKRSIGFYILLVLIAFLLGGGSFFGLNYDTYKQHIPFLADTIPQHNNGDSRTEELQTLVTDALLETTESDDIDELITETIDAFIAPTVEPKIEVEEETEVAKTEPIEQLESTEENLSFHIIAGAFSTESNANRLGDKLRNEGYTITIGEGRGMTLVSIQSFKTRAEAKIGLVELKTVVPKAWIHKW